MVGALYGRRLCEDTVGLLEEKGVSTWQSAGAVDKTEWVHQIRTLTTIFPPYQLQEDGHPNYWGQLALRNCFRQAYNGGAARRRLLLARHRAQRQGRAEHVAVVGVRSGAWSAGSSSYSRCSPAGCSPRRRTRRTCSRCGGAMCGSISRPLNPAQPNGPEDRHRVPLVPGEGRDRAADRRRRGRAGLPVDRDPRRVPLDLRAAAAHALAAARRQPRDRRLGADRLQERAVVRGPHLRERVRAAGGPVRDRDRRSSTARARRACSPPSTRSTTSPRCSGRWGSRSSTSTATPTARSSSRTSSPAIPTALRSVVLDSAYPRRDLDPWYVSSGAAVRAALETVSPGSVARLGELLAQVRDEPIRGRDARRRQQRAAGPRHPARARRTWSRTRRRTR